MQVTVRLFAMLRERAGASEVTLELAEGARVRDALAQLDDLAAGLPLVMAVNREYADEDETLGPGDELALIPPVSGGEAAASEWVRVTGEPLALGAVAERVRDPRAGAVVVFQGVTREVDELHYEAYVEMAEERLAAIAREVAGRHGLCAAAVEHRVGRVPLSEPSVVAAASAPHRGEAFAGARELIDRVKAEAPIWKKEVEAGDERWVEGTSPLDKRSALRALPSVEELSTRLGGAPKPVAVRAAREALEAARERVLGGGSAGELEKDALARAAGALRPSLRQVLNATGVIVHTNLGRAPLAPGAARAALDAGSGYSNLEYDLERGGRGSRQAHVEGLVRELTGAEAALVVNNCAAAVLLAAAALAAGRELVVSRGQLVEIGGSFRIPDVVAQSGARLVEVGTTNRTRLEDYERATGPDTGALLRAHSSNFRVVGFSEEVEIEDLCRVGAAHGVPVIDDLGSGALAEGMPELAGEPSVRRSVAAGAAVACFSGDKLLGGPQTGVMAGTAAAIERCRAHPLARALRIDKLSLAALESTLRSYRAGDERELPVLRMLVAGEEELAGRAERMRAALAEAGVDASVLRATAKAGGGALPLLELEGPVCAVDPGSLGLDALAGRLRRGDPPLVGRAREGWLLLDPRTLDDDEASAAAGVVAAALRS